MMYNRYIPQPDGTYRRNSIQDFSLEPHRPEPPRPCPVPDAPGSSSCPNDPPPRPGNPPCGPRRPSPPKRPANPSSCNGIGGFFRQLLPKDFDTEDLLVVILLLLMAGDCQEEQNSALLTLALYLFL